ncbi:MAG TPA: restriction endonuclease [Firmicutes bacterium]|nr:restriction endonuclease [Bacillota bacterium]
MTIPGFQAFMLPFLNQLADKTEKRMADLFEVLANEFQLTENDKKEQLSRGQLKFKNRISWARTYLLKARLIKSTGRGLVQITARGQQVLTNPPEKITISYLEQFPEFVEFRYGGKQEPEGTDKGKEEQQSPDEGMAMLYKEISDALADELLEKIKSCSPAFFERLVVDLLLAMGYGGSREDAGEAIGTSGDGGVDGIIKEDRLGLDVIYIQAKRWENTVGRPVVQGFAGSLEGLRAKKGVLITTSSFSQEAENYVKRIEKKIVLIDGKTLARLMIDFDVGVSEIVTYRIKKLDLDYFEEMS